MSDVPKQLQYTREHEWLRREDDGTVVVGITDHAQHQLGELVYVELPEAGRTLKPGDAHGGGRVHQGGVRCLCAAGRHRGRR